MNLLLSNEQTSFSHERCREGAETATAKARVTEEVGTKLMMTPRKVRLTLLC